MEHASKPLSPRDLDAGPPAWDARVLEEDWRLARTAHVNLLLLHRTRPIDNLLKLIVKDLPAPILTWTAGDRLVLPPLGRVGTLVLREVGSLHGEDQGRLLQWLERAAGQTQVVSTTSLPLLSRVQSGRFDETLYYRLNTVYVDVTA